MSITNWQYDETDYKNHKYDNLLIPEGDHRVRIENAEPKVFKNGNEGFEIELSVEGFSSKLWYCMSFDVNDRQKTNQRIGAFFDSFGITNHNLATYPQWAGAYGMVHVKHNNWQGNTYANVVYCINKATQMKRLGQTSQATSQALQTASRNVFDDCINNSTVNPNRPTRIPVDYRF